MSLSVPMMSQMGKLGKWRPSCPLPASSHPRRPGLVHQSLCPTCALGWGGRGGQQDARPLGGAKRVCVAAYSLGWSTTHLPRSSLWDGRGPVGRRLLSCHHLGPLGFSSAAINLDFPLFLNLK